MITYTFTQDFVARFDKWLKSSEYGNVGQEAKTEYWQHFSRQIMVDVSKQDISIGGQSGFYVPDLKRGPAGKALVAIKKFLKVILSYVRCVLGAGGTGLRLLDIYDAFDRVMGHDPIADVVVSPHRINFKEMRSKDGVVGTINDMRRKYAF